MIYAGLPDWRELSFLRDQLAESDGCFVDIGANLGIYSLWVADVTQGHVRSIAFEPSSDIYGRLAENVRINSFEDVISTRRVAVSDESGEVDITRGRGTTNRVLAGADVPEGGYERVGVVALDDLDWTEPVRVVKIDVEGHERHVLQGSLGLIRDHQPALIIEWNDGEELAELLGQIEYRLTSYDPIGRSFFRLFPRAMDIRELYQNVIAVPQYFELNFTRDAPRILPEQSSTEPAVSVFIVTNQPTPYRDELFTELSHEVDLHVAYLASRETNRDWEAGGHKRDYGTTFLNRTVRKPGASFSVRAVKPLMEAIDQVDPCVIVVGGYETPAVVVSSVLEARRRGIPVVLWSGTHNYSVSNEGWLARRYRGWAFRSVDGVLAYSTKAADFAASHGAASVSVLGNPHRTRLEAGAPTRDSDKIAPRPRAPRIGGAPRAGQLRVAYVGRLIPEKGVMEAVEGVELASRFLDIELQVVGTGPLHQEVECRPHVTCHGWKDGRDLVDVLSRCDVLLFPSATDPWGLVVSEAMELGLLVICDYRSGCVPDVAQDGVSAVVSDLATPQSIAACLGYVAEMPDPEWRRLRSGARVKVSRHRPAVGARRFGAVVKGLAAPGPPE